MKKIAMSDYEEISEYLNRLPKQVSELSFANLFMWRDYYNFSFFISQDRLYVISEGCENRKPFALFTFANAHDLQSSPEEILHPLKEIFYQNEWELLFSRLTMPQAEALCAIPQKGLPAKMFYDPNNDDYIYATNDLVSLCGKKFSKKRNHINKFLSLYTYEYQPLCDENLNEVQEFLQHMYQGEVSQSYEQQFAEQELLSHYHDLGCKGALILADGKVCACTIGELLTSDTAVIHLEKADRKIEGAYAICNQMFCENEWENTTYINREQDLGIVGLRKAKRSYYPVKMGSKYYVVL